MPVDYHVLKGHVGDLTFKGHLQILVNAPDDDGHATQWRIAFNVKSDTKPFPVRYYIDEDYQDQEMIKKLTALPAGLTPKSTVKNDDAHQDMVDKHLNLDFVRGNLLPDQKVWEDLAAGTPDEQNELHYLVGDFIKHAKGDPNAFVCAFGAAWLDPPNAPPDPYFQFKPSRGVHDIHMNQGSGVDGNGHGKDDGVGQDGALFIYLPSTNRWVAAFVSFQSQSFQTDPQTGHRTDGG